VLCIEKTKCGWKEFLIQVYDEALKTIDMDELIKWKENVVARESEELMNLFKQGPSLKEHARHFVTDEQFEDVDQSHARESVGMENCDDWKAARSEARQDAMPAKHSRSTIWTMFSRYHDTGFQ
jgi:regulator of replication initiation timing